MLFEPFEHADVRKSERAAALQRHTNPRPPFRLVLHARCCWSFFFCAL